MLLEHCLDARGARSALDAGDDLAFGDKHDSRHKLHSELRDEICAYLGIDLNDAETMTFLARDVRNKAFHSPRRA